MVSRSVFYGVLVILVVSFMVFRWFLGLFVSMRMLGLVLEMMVVKFVVCSVCIRCCVLGIVFVW